MRNILASLAALALLAACSSMPGHSGPTGRAGLEEVAKALGAPGLRSIQYAGRGTNNAVGQSAVPSAAWPRFTVVSFTRTVNYETASLRDELVRTQLENPVRGGGGQPIRGEQRQALLLSGDHAWNVVGDAAVPVPVALADRQLQLWATPHGIVKAALARDGRFEGRVIAVEAPGRFRARATVDAANLIERVDAVLAHPVVGDLPVQITYADYRDFGGVKFPTRIRQQAGGFASLDLTVTDVRPNAAADVAAPDAVRQAAGFYSRVATQMAADGVWYLAGGTHHSVVIEMRDHGILVETPLNDERTLAVLAEARSLLGSKPLRFVVNSHHHYDHAGGVRAAGAEPVTILTHEVNRAFVDGILAAPATVAPDHLARSGRKATVEGVRDRRVLTDGARTVEVHHIAANPHHEGMLMVYLPRERLLIQADAFTPAPPNTPPATPANPFNVNLADNIARLKLDVDRLLPLHGRIVPLAELQRAIGRAN